MDEWNWYRDRLADKRLLVHAETVYLYGVDEDGDEYEVSVLAVPVGGLRRGGFISLTERDHVQQAMEHLSNWKGFPNLRAEYSDDDDVCHVVRWGDEPPPTPSIDDDDAAWEKSDIEHGRFYGYSEDAIARYLKRDTRDITP